jgi:hypothetical protein
VLYLFEGCALDTDRRELRRGVGLIPVEPQVFDLLEHLISSRERVVSKDEATVKIHVSAILSALKAANRTEAVIAAGALGFSPKPDAE